ncbi:hypothetical protein [Hyalangium sp.]|uniref:hypothetical protein n=1 Tax=Hyalangium sp. TaxID=2028555 RepID=UPI002D6B775B|nr:hypothetical protein [Hyalangium sp.]HYH97238.1 hypothetical protein [Hyalangium sp.]
MVFCALMTVHPMVGVDLHDGIPPPGPVPVPKIPHFTVATLKWLLPTSTPTPKVQGPFGFSLMQQGTDIGNFLPHVAANYLLPLVIATSGSKSHFGASTVQSEGKPTAAAILVAVNLNLNCAGAAMPPLPSGFVVAPNTVLVGLTLGDVLGGIFSMAVDCAIQFGLNRLFASQRVGNLFTRLQGPLIRALMPNAPRFVSLTTALFGQSSRILSNPYVANTLGNLLPTAVGVLLGSPLGYTPPTGVVGNTSSAVNDWARGKGEQLGNAISSLFDDPATPQYPTRAPTPGGS